MPRPEPAITPVLVAAHGLKPDEYDRFVALIGRTPSFTELGIVSAMWNEHCSYKSSRLHLRTLPTTGTRVIQGPGENAGVVDIGDGLACVFKMESHNHPSFIEPRQGAATGVGGILRDVFTMGARPIACLDVLRFGAPAHPRTRHLVAGVVAGIGGYGNAFGVSTFGGRLAFDPSYDGNILVNAMAVGIARADAIFTSIAAGVGRPIVYLGSKTGRDGIGGAAMASAAFETGTEAMRPTVQVGDPFAEKLLLEACLELMATGAVVAIQDMGAAGLTSSAVEMGAKGGLGIELDLDRVPTREAGMSAYEMMLSESQERMLMVLDPAKAVEAEAVFRRWNLDFAVIGQTTDTLRFVVRHRGAIEADLPIRELGDQAPLYDRPYVATAALPVLAAEAVAAPMANGAALLALLGGPDLCGKAWVWEQYDHLIGGNTLVGPGQAEAAVVRVGDGPKALALTACVTPRYCAADPREGGRQAVAAAWRTLVAVGATPLALTDNLNFGNPEKPEAMGQLVGCIAGIGEAARKLAFPVVSGNVSLYNETSGRGILPTPTVGGVGLIEDAAAVMTPAIGAEGLAVLLVGDTRGWLGQSLYLREVCGRAEGAPPPVDLDAEARAGDLVRRAIAGRLVAAVRTVSDGGALGALADMCLAGGIGAEVEEVADPSGAPLPPHAALFGEDQGRYLLACAPEQEGSIRGLAEMAAVPIARLAVTGGTALTLPREPPILVDDLRRARDAWLPGFMRAADER